MPTEPVSGASCLLSYTRFARVFALILAGCVMGMYMSCSGDDVPNRIVLVTPDNPGSGLEIAATQFTSLLSAAAPMPVERVPASEATTIQPGAYVISLGPTALTDLLIPTAERQALKPGGYIIRGGSTQGMQLLAGSGLTDLEDQYAAYEILVTMGFGFYQPRETFVPSTPVLPGESTNEVHEPDLDWRGTHEHTEHPIPYMFAFLLPSEEHLEDSKRYIDWLVANRMNFFQWVLLDTIDLEAWIPYAARIIEYAHKRGVRVGNDTGLQEIQQNALSFAPKPLRPWKPQLDHTLEILMQAPWDYIMTTLGAGEFIPANDIETVDMLNYLAKRLNEDFSAEMFASIHVSTGQTAPHFDNINFNFLPGVCNPNVGVMVHTVQFYDLYEPAPTYGRENFHDLGQFMKEQVGKRLDLYYPETAYWITFDNSVPLFLPAYVLSRWTDLHSLLSWNPRVDGQIVFQSGFEWGYWLFNWATAGYAYDADPDWPEYLKRFTRIFGDGANAMQELLVDITLEQKEDLIDKLVTVDAKGNKTDFIGFLLGHNAAVDVGGDLFHTYSEPRRINFSQVYKMNASELESFETDVLSVLAEMAGKYKGFMERAEAIAPLVPAGAMNWYNEMRRSIQVTGLRVLQMHSLYQGVVLARKQELGLDPQGAGLAARWFDDARRFRGEAQVLVLEQEKDYRWPLDMIARPVKNPTAYEFGYLYPVSNCMYWVRDEAEAIYRDNCMCLMNIEDLVGALFGETSLIAMLANSFPPILGPCLNLCLHPVIPPQSPVP